MKGVAGRLLRPYWGLSFGREMGDVEATVPRTSALNQHFRRRRGWVLTRWGKVARHLWSVRLFWGDRWKTIGDGEEMADLITNFIRNTKLFHFQ